MRSNILKVIIIDQNFNAHNAYKQYFEDFEEYQLLGIYRSAEGALFEFDEVMPDIVISEVSLPKMNGIDSIPLYLQKNESANVIMISAQSDFETVKKAFKNGASGFLSKPMTKNRLYHALNSIRTEGAIISNDITKKVIKMFQPKSYQAFSKRENQIINHLCQGATYKTIAEKLFVTTSAINFHIQNIYLKLNVNSKSEALSKLREIEYA